jgi:uncharacterized repeat protein (TIGR01451 family)
MAFPPALVFAAQLFVAQTLGELNPPASASFEGNVDYFATGNTLAMPYQGTLGGRHDGLGCLRSSGKATIPAGTLSARATVLQAFLYWSGNQVERASALTSIDPSVKLQLPGQTTSLPVTATDIHTVSYTEGNHNGDQDTFYSARADITAIVQANKVFTGDYVFSGLETPVCYQFDVACKDGVADADQPECDITIGDVNENATASFFIVLVYADPALPPRNVTLYDGLQLVNTANPEVDVPLTGLDVSPIPRGKLTGYTVEGDLDITGDTISVSAGGRTEQLLGMNVTPAPTIADLEAQECSSAAWPNWDQNIFDSSITAPGTSSQCVRGVDIDTFDISSYLAPGDTQLDMTIRTGQDSIAVVFAAIGVDVFRPVLNVDSRKQVLGLNALNQIQPKTVLTYRVGISNTGNVAATKVIVTDDMPPSVSELKVLITPPGSTDASTATGGRHGTGQVTVSNISVNPGDVLEVRYQVTVTCPVSDGAILRNSAAISASAEGAAGANLIAPNVTVTDPNGDICAGRKQPNSPTTTTILLDRRLLGGAGCAQTGGVEIAAWAAAGLLLLRRRRSLLFVLALWHCSKGVAPPVPPKPVTSTIPTAPPQPAVLPGKPCSDPTMVQLPSGVCIDRFEETVTGALGDADQSSGANGSSTGAATVTYGSVPTAGVSYYQAKALCEGASKRLCSDVEWEQACRGASLFLYPYGDSFEQAKCNGFDAEIGQVVQAGAMTACVSEFGAFDLSGNLSEWIEADIPLITGASGKQIRGGSFVGNPSGLSCSVQIGEAPATTDPRAGIRCCK